MQIKGHIYKPVTKMNTIIYNSYGDLQETLSHLNSLKINSNTWGGISDCYTAVLVHADHLESPIAFNPEHNGYITGIFQDILIINSVSGKFRSIRRLKSLLRNFVFVTRMSCDLRNSLHTSPLFNSLRMNGATLLTQSGGNPLIERNGRNTSLCF